MNGKTLIENYTREELEAALKEARRKLVQVCKVTSMRHCTKCDTFKPVSNFAVKYVNKNTGKVVLRNDCKDCTAKYQTKWRNENAEYVVSLNAAQYQLRKERKNAKNN